MTNPKWLSDYPKLQSQVRTELLGRLGAQKLSDELWPKHTPTDRFVCWAKQILIWHGLKPEYHL